MNNTHTISYSARALRKPLADLCTKFETHLATLEPKLIDASKLTQRTNRTLAPLSDPEIAAAKIISEHRRLTGELQRARLWLMECRRLWFWVRFRLTMDELAWLYQQRGVADAKTSTV